ncbi:MAG: DNA polymerase IV [Candidatus Omnitrophota bacterium]
MSVNTANQFITLISYPKVILHIDADAFFASCEQARQPSLKGKPLVTGKERGIISCASYQAKALGIKRGVSLSEAKKICPGLIIMPSDYETYSLYSERMFEIIRRFTPCVEEYSIDEAFCDLTGLRRLYRCSYPDIARMIKENIQKELDLTVSVGVSLSKTLAKICSRHNKPDGFTVLPGRKLHEFLKNIPLIMVCGFGDSTVELLTRFGISNILGYIQRPVEFAKKLLGKVGVELWHELRGEAIYQVNVQEKEKYLSISKTKTFMPVSANKDFVKAQLVKNLESACIKLRRYNLGAQNLTAYLRSADFKDFGLQAGLNRNSSSTLDFSGICSQLFEMIFKPGVYYRASGVILSRILPQGVDERTLFDDPLKIEQLFQVSCAVDKVNQRFGKHTLHLAASNLAMRNKNDHPRNNSAGRKKELLKGETFRRRLGIPLLKLN